MAEPFEDDPLENGWPFDGLGEVAARFGVRLTLTGGAATRLMIDLMGDAPLRVLPAYCAFTDAVNLEHSGPDSLSEGLEAAVRSAVPFGDWCRWIVRSESRARGLRRQRGQTRPAPLRSFRFGLDEPVRASANALPDLRSGRIHLARASEVAAYRGGLAHDLWRAVEALEIAGDFEARGRDSEIDLREFEEALLRFQETEESIRPEVRHRLRFALASLEVRSGAKILPLVNTVADAAGLSSLTSGAGLSAGTTFLIPELRSSGGRAPELLPLDSRPDEVLSSLGCALDDAFLVEGICVPWRLPRSPWREARGYAKPEFVHLAWVGPNTIDGGAVLPGARDDPVNSSISDAGQFRNGVNWARVDIAPALRSGVETIRIGLLGRAKPEPGPMPDPWPILGLDPTDDRVELPVEYEFTPQYPAATERLLGRETNAEFWGDMSGTPALPSPRRVRIGEDEN